MLTSEILKQAKARLTPETWGQGLDALMSSEALECAGMAIWRAGCSRRAMTLFASVATGYAGRNDASVAIVHWNDARERTLQDVHDAFDASIAIAEQQEAVETSEAVLVTA